MTPASGRWEPSGAEGHAQRHRGFADRQQGRLVVGYTAARRRVLLPPQTPRPWVSTIAGLVPGSVATAAALVLVGFCGLISDPELPWSQTHEVMATLGLFWGVATGSVLWSARICTPPALVAILAVLAWIVAAASWGEQEMMAAHASTAWGGLLWVEYIIIRAR